MSQRNIKLIKNTSLLFFGNVGSKMIAFIMLPFYTKYLSSSEYGVSDIINTYASIIIAFITFCLSDSIFVNIKQKDCSEEKEQLFSTGIVYSISSYVAFAFLFFIIVKFIGYPDFLNSFVDNFGYIFFLSFTMFIQNYTQQYTLGLGNALCYSLTGIVMTFSIALLALCLLPKYGINGYLLSLILAHLIATLFNVTSAKLYKHFSIKFINQKSLKILFQYGVPLVPNSILWWIINGINRPIIESTIGISAVGIFAIASKFPNVLSIVFNVLSNAWNITVIEEFGKNDSNYYFNKVFKLCYFFLISLGVLISIFSRFIVNIFATPEYYEAWHYIPILTLGVIFYSMSGLIGSIFMAQKKSKFFAYSSFWGAITSLLCTIVGVKYWGLYGASCAVVLSFFTICVSRIFYAWQYINKMDFSFYIMTTICYLIITTLVLSDLSLVLSLYIPLLLLIVIWVVNRNIYIPIINIICLKFKAIRNKFS